jgi:molybdopterin converting factor small subunit
LPVVWIPSLLRPLVGGHETVTVEGETVGQVMANLEQHYPGIRARLFQGDRLRPNLSLLVDGELSTRGLLQKVREDSEIRFIPAIHGGSTVGAKKTASCG